MEYTALIPSNNETLAYQTKNCFPDDHVRIFWGHNYPSFSKLMNDCIMEAEHETVIIINHKIRGNMMHINKMLYLLNKGYGLVGLQNFRMFGFKKDLIRKIGWFDERFVGGCFEDSDFVRRIIEADIAWYDAREVPVMESACLWDSSKAKEHFYKKWKDGEMERLMEDETYDYDIGPYQGTKFLPKSKTVLSKPNQDYYDSINYKFV